MSNGPGRGTPASSQIVFLEGRVAELEQQVELYRAEMSAAREAGFTSAQDLFTSYQGVLAALDDGLVKLGQLDDTRIHDLSAVIPLTHRKTQDIVRQRGYKVTGFVLTDEAGRKCIVDMSAVRWFDEREKFFRMMHAQDGPNAAQIVEELERKSDERLIRELSREPTEHEKAVYESLRKGEA